MAMEQKRIKQILAMSKVKQLQALKNQYVYGVISLKK
jgi:hypothetical protein